MHENEIRESRLRINRRHFLSKMSIGIGSAALGSLLIPSLLVGETTMMYWRQLFLTLHPKPSELFIYSRAEPLRNWNLSITNPFSTSEWEKTYLHLYEAISVSPE